VGALHTHRGAHGDGGRHRRFLSGSTLFRCRSSAGIPRFRTPGKAVLPSAAG